MATAICFIVIQGLHIPPPKKKKKIPGNINYHELLVRNQEAAQQLLSRFLDYTIPTEKVPSPVS